MVRCFWKTVTDDVYRTGRWTSMVLVDGGQSKWRADAVIDWIISVHVDDASALLDVLKGVSSAGGGSVTGNITPMPSLKYSWSFNFKGAAQSEGGRLVEGGMKMDQRGRKTHHVQSYGGPQGCYTGRNQNWRPSWLNPGDKLSGNALKKAQQWFAWWDISSTNGSLMHRLRADWEGFGKCWVHGSWQLAQPAWQSLSHQSVTRTTFC